VYAPDGGGAEPLAATLEATVTQQFGVESVERGPVDVADRQGADPGDHMVRQVTHIADEGVGSDGHLDRGKPPLDQELLDGRLS
jgi:hypothetical protein